MKRLPRSWTLAFSTGILAIVAATLGSFGVFAAQSDNTSVWDGVFTSDQAARGEDAYAQECAPCHLDDLLGDGIAPALTGAGFDFRWSDLSVGDMFASIRATMPQVAPASLSAQAYIDIISYILQANDLPAGENELPTDEAPLSQIIILSEHPAAAQEFAAGEPIGALNEAGVWQPMSDNVTVYGSFHFSESCTFDSNRNLILAMNTGNRGDTSENDGFVSLINPDGSVHTPKWIGATRDGLELYDPLGSAISNGVLYTVDVGYVRLFDLETGRPLQSIPVPESTILNGIAVADDGTVYASNTRNPEQIWKVTADGEVSVFAEGAPLAAPNGVAIDQDGNIVVVNVGDNAIITYDQDGAVIRIEHSVEGGNDGIVITADGTKYASSVRYGSVSRIRPGQEAEVIASGIPSAASMCYDSTQNQLVIPLNSNYALAFVRVNSQD